MSESFSQARRGVKPHRASQIAGFPRLLLSIAESSELTPCLPARLRSASRASSSFAGHVGSESALGEVCLAEAPEGSEGGPLPIVLSTIFQRILNRRIRQSPSAKPFVSARSSQNRGRCGSCAIVGMGPRRFVYILRSDTHADRHYVGLTSDVAGRLHWHNTGPSGVTVHHRPGHSSSR